MELQNDCFVGLDGRWIDIDSKVSVDDVDVGTVRVDPLLNAFYVSERF